MLDHREITIDVERPVAIALAGRNTVVDIAIAVLEGAENLTTTTAPVMAVLHLDEDRLWTTIVPRVAGEDTKIPTDVTTDLPRRTATAVVHHRTIDLPTMDLLVANFLLVVTSLLAIVDILLVMEDTALHVVVRITVEVPVAALAAAVIGNLFLQVLPSGFTALLFSRSTIAYTSDKNQ